MRTCARCGETVDDDVDACPKCGADLRDPTAAFPVVPAGEKELTGEMPRTEGPLLVVRKGPDVGETFYLDRSEFTIGRDPDADIFLNDVTVSRHHAKLVVSGDEVTAEDTDSLNGTYVNGVRVDKARLNSGDALQIGRFQMVFLAGGGQG
jgi:pSer/pThr/pTyr-binding forkhead associated (FHA) protein